MLRETFGKIPEVWENAVGECWRKERERVREYSANVQATMRWNAEPRTEECYEDIKAHAHTHTLHKIPMELTGNWEIRNKQTNKY